MSHSDFKGRKIYKDGETKTLKETNELNYTSNNNITILEGKKDGELAQPIFK